MFLQVFKAWAFKIKCSWSHAWPQKKLILLSFPEFTCYNDFKDGGPHETHFVSITSDFIVFPCLCSGGPGNGSKFFRSRQIPLRRGRPGQGLSSSGKHEGRKSA